MLDASGIPIGWHWDSSHPYTLVRNDSGQRTAMDVNEERVIVEALSWHSKVFLNPPYNGDTAQWSRRLVEQYEAGNVTEAILLVFSKFGYVWFEELFDAYPVALARERIRFVNSETGEGAQAKHNSSFVYFAPNRKRFCELFCHIGRVFYPEEGR